MPADEVLAKADDNMLATWRAVIQAGPAGRMRDEDDVVLLSSGAPVSLLNPAMVTAPPPDPGALVARVRAHYDALAVPFVLYFRDAGAAGLADACTAAGLIEHFQPPLMALDPIPDEAPIDPSPSGIDIAAVDGDTLDAYRETLAAGFGMPAELAAVLLTEQTLALDAFTGFLATVDGVPAATSGLVLSDGVAGIYNVSTLPAYRGKGLGAAITWAAARAGAEAGRTLAILQSSKEGEPVYRRMGFDVLDRYRQFEPKP